MTFFIQKPVFLLVPVFACRHVESIRVQQKKWRTCMKSFPKKLQDQHERSQHLVTLVSFVLGGVSLLTGTGVLYQAFASARDKRRYAAPGTFIDVGGHRLHALCHGEKSPTVILDAGLGGSSLDWSLIQTEVATFAQVCSYDRAGYGWSDPGPKPRSSQQIVNELYTLLPKIGMKPPYILVGHSFGGLNMRLYACQHPEQVAGMVLVDASPEDQRTRMPKPPFKEKLGQQIQWQMFRLRPFLARLGLLRLQGKPNGVIEALPTVLQPVARAIGLRSEAYDWIFGEAQAIELSEAQIRAATSFPPIPLIVLTAAGGDWPNTEVKHCWLELQAELARLSPQGSHRVIEKSGHFIQIDQPHLVINAIREIVNMVRHGASSKA
jgi:pimeloyl-ACP methyl ester carboxylesterase